MPLFIEPSEAFSYTDEGSVHSLDMTDRIHIASFTATYTLKFYHDDLGWTIVMKNEPVLTW